MKKIYRIFLLAATALLLVLVVRHFLGFSEYSNYKKIRSEVPNIERGFPTMEASLKRVLRNSENPLYYKEFGRLCLERALTEVKFGGPESENREHYLDLAVEALGREIQLNPLDAWAYYDMGKAWMLTNYPLLTYAEKGRAYFRKALEFAPANEFLNLTVLVTHMAQSDDLTAEG